MLVITGDGSAAPPSATQVGQLNVVVAGESVSITLGGWAAPGKIAFDLGSGAWSVQ